MPSTIESLAAYVSSALDRPLPAEVVQKTKFHILDTVAAMVTGSRLGPGQAAIKFVSSQGGTTELVDSLRPVITAAEVSDRFSDLKLPDARAGAGLKLMDTPTGAGDW